jgi:hypothetical protein
MAMNKTILGKLSEKTTEKPEMRGFLMEIIQFESSKKGWYTESYIELLEKYCPEEKEL